MFILDNFFEFIYPVGCFFNMHSITASGLIARGKYSGRGRQTVFFTAVNSMNTHCSEEKEFDLTKPRLVAHKQTWEIHQDAVLSRHGSCSKNGIKILPNKLKRDHSLRHCSADLH